ncbi:MAG: YdcF family protein [Aureispira sp.]|nr:YdcF family protein [Aureispira sp.]
MKHKTYLLLKILLTWYAIHSAFIIIDGLTDEVVSCDVVVILGNKVNENGQLSERLKARVDKGLQLYQKGWYQQILVSGGLGKEGHLEGDAMAAYLIQKGVPSAAILIDNKGNNTNATALNTKALFSSQTSITIVSQYYHISRTRLAFQKAGFTSIYGVHADYFELRDFYSIFREFFGYYKYWWL